MDIFWRLLLGHLLADFTCQTNFVAAWKRRSARGLFFHVTTHPVMYLALLWPRMNEVWVTAGAWRLNGWTAVGIVYATHLLEDKWRIWSVMERGAPDNSVFYLWDQIIHIVILYAVSPASVPAVQSRWPILGCLLVVVMHFATVSVYFLEKDLFGSEFPADAPKYAWMGLRFLVFAGFFLPGGWWLLAPALAVAQAPLAGRGPALALSRAGFWLGQVITVAAGAAGRWVWLRA
jgi:hypothetical protein